MVSQMAEDNSAEPPSPFHTSSSGCQNTSIVDPYRATISGQISYLLIGNFLEQVLKKYKIPLLYLTKDVYNYVTWSEGEESQRLFSTGTANPKLTW